MAGFSSFLVFSITLKADFFLTLLSLVKAQTTLSPTATCVAPKSGLGESTTVQEVPVVNHKDIFWI